MCKDTVDYFEMAKKDARMLDAEIKFMNGVRDGSLQFAMGRVFEVEVEDRCENPNCRVILTASNRDNIYKKSCKDCVWDLRCEN